MFPDELSVLLSYRSTTDIYMIKFFFSVRKCCEYIFSHVRRFTCFFNLAIVLFIYRCHFIYVVCTKLCKVIRDNNLHFQLGTFQDFYQKYIETIYYFDVLILNNSRTLLPFDYKFNIVDAKHFRIFKINFL